jgi:hypothetical protein
MPTKKSPSWKRARYSCRLYRHPNAGIDGRAQAGPVRSDRWPPIKIVATSGRVIIGDEDLPGGSVFLPKPYRGAEVVATLREMTTAA